MLYGLQEDYIWFEKHIYKYIQRDEYCKEQKDGQRNL